ncbi:transglycosylase SLT domain-containing protein [Serratia liquefaciens]
MVLDELVLALGIDDKSFQTGEQAVVAGLDRLTAVMENVAQAFDTGEKKNSEALDKTGKKAEKTAKDMETSGKKASSFFSSIRTQVLALAGVTLSLSGLKSFVTGFTNNLNQLATAADAFGMSAKSLDGWVKAGEAFGVSANETVSAFSRINDAKAKFKAGESFDPALQSLLITAAQAGFTVDLATDSTEDIMRKLAQAFPKLNKDQQQAYGSSLGYSYAGQQFLGSGQALKKVDEYTDRSGVDERSIAAARKFREQWAEISQSFEKTGYILFNALLPYIEQFNVWLNDLATWMAQHPDEIKAAIQGVLDVLSGIVGTASEAAKAVGGWQNAILLLVSASVGGKLLSLFKGLGGAIMGPAGLIAALVALEEFVVKPLEEKYPALKNNPVADTLNNLPFSDMVDGWGKSVHDWFQEKTGINLPRGDGYGQSTEPEQHAQSVRRPQPTKEGEALLGWLQPKLSKLEETFKLPPGLLRSIAITESGGNPEAVSGAGAKGLFQFMPDTAKDFGLKGRDVFDPEKSALAAAQYMSQLMKMFDGDLGKALAAYNWGQGNVMRKGMDAAPKETREYVPKVLANLPQPGANMAAQSRQSVAGPQSTITETIHIGTLNANTTAGNVKGITDDARQKINRSSLVSSFASGVST